MIIEAIRFCNKIIGSKVTIQDELTVGELEVPFTFVLRTTASTAEDAVKEVHNLKHTPRSPWGKVIEARGDRRELQREFRLVDTLEHTIQIKALGVMPMEELAHAVIEEAKEYPQPTHPHYTPETGEITVNDATVELSFEGGDHVLVYDNTLDLYEAIGEVLTHARDIYPLQECWGLEVGANRYLLQTNDLMTLIEYLDDNYC